MTDFKVGRVSHFYDKIGVAIVELSSPLGTGDKIKFVRGGEELFEQGVDSMQVEHEKIQKADKGQSVGIKTEKPIKEGAEVYRVVE